MVFELAILKRAQDVADGGGTGVIGLEDDDVGHDGVERVARAELRGGFEFTGVDGAVDVEGAEEIDDALAAGWVDAHGGVVGDVVVEVATYLVVGVGDCGRAEEQARALDGAGSEDEVRGGEGELFAGVVEDADGLDACSGLRGRR